MYPQLNVRDPQMFRSRWQGPLARRKGPLGVNIAHFGNIIYYDKYYKFEYK